MNSNDVSNLPVAKRLVVSDDPVVLGRTASIAISRKFLPAIVTQLLQENLAFVFMPYTEAIGMLTCPIDEAEILVNAVQKAEGHS